MKKTGKNDSFQERTYWKKSFLIMKMVTFFLLVNFFIVHANDVRSQDQKVSLKTKNSTVIEALNLLRSSSKLKILYSPEELNSSSVISVDFENASIEAVLKELLKNQAVGYVVEEDKIIISRKRFIEPSSVVSSQQQQMSVKGIVTDVGGQPLPGVSVSIKGTTQGTITDFNGNYSIEVPVKANVLVFSFLGMITQEVKIDGKAQINIIMVEDTKGIEEVMVVGYGKQKKVSVVGSIQSIGVQDLKVPSSNISNSFAGRLAGVIAFQRSGEPGADGSNFYIRGISTFGGATNPLIIIDGVQVSQGDLNALSPEVIESFSILKDATATALYGTRGANGVMIVTTKSGKDMPKAKVNIRVENMFSMPTSVPEFVDGPKFMEMYNEAVLGRNTGDIPYTREKIEGTRNNLDPYIYPNVDWYDELFKNMAVNQSANMNVTGGGKKADYFMNLAVNMDNGVLKKFNVNSFDNNIKLQRYSFQNNVNTYLTETTRLSLRLNTQIRDYHGPAMAAADVFGLVMEANPVDFPIMFPQQDGIGHIMFGGKAGGRFNDGFRNPFAEMVKGYTDNFQSTVIATVDGEQKLNFITEGLVFRAMASFKNWTSTTVTRSAGYNQYAVDNVVRNEDGTYGYDLAMVGNVQGTTLGTTTSKTGDRSLYYQAQLQYDRTFNEIHSVSGMVLYNQDEYMVNAPDGLIASLPKRKQGIASRMTYGFKDRYLAEFNFGYNGSENFAKGNRFGFFPSFALGYVMSGEKFWEPIEHVVSWMKIRGSWGKVGNDQIGTERFLYLSDVNLTGAGFTTGLNQNYSKSGPVYNRYANPNLSWEVGEKINIGFDMGLYNKINFTLDLYKEKREGIFLARGVIPTSFGTDGTNIYGNLGKVENEGIDMSLDINHKFSDDFSMQFKGTFTYAHNTVLDKDEPLFTKYPNLSAKGHSINSLWGYEAERLFIDQAEINNSALQQLGGTILPGDIKYTDITNDIDALNLVNSDDRRVMGHPTIPEIVYGFGPSFKFKNLDCSFYFQGVARTSFFINGFHPFGTSDIRNVLKFIADDYWNEETQNIHAAYPRLSKLNHPNNTANSSYWLRDGSFLKLKNVEIGYTYKFARVYLSGLNVLTLSKFKLWDPEQGGGNGLSYPTQRVFSVGLQMQL